MRKHFETLFHGLPPLRRMGVVLMLVATTAVAFFFGALGGCLRGWE